MANIMSQVKLKNGVSRNGFDLGRKNAFTAKVGELLPVACIECIPGDKYKGRIQHFTRTMPVNTAAYTRIREYYDWFFVPTNLLWNKFNTFVTQMTDNNQHATSITDSQVLTNQHPYFTTNQVAALLKSWSSNGNNNMFGFNRAQLSAKLLEYLDYGDFYASANGEDQVFRTNLNLNPFPLLAYQKIYQDYFRNSQWENAYAPAFNIDYISGAQSSLNIPISNITTAGNFFTMFDMQYCNWNKDLFMGVLPNSQFGAAASVIIDSNPSSAGIQNLALRSVEPTTTPAAPLMQSSIQNPFQSVLAYNGRIAFGFSGQTLESLADSFNSNFSILALRQAEALQKWQEITQSQQQDYKNQIEAHFGVSPSDALSDRCKYIDGSVSNLDISEVTNQNLADDNAADIAGRGVGVGQSSFNFSTDVHGYLMCIYHAVPLLDYAIDGVARVNTKTMVTDYAIPEFDKTGMVQVTFNELSNSISQQSAAVPFLGYAPRYYDYKIAIDKVHGAFKNGGLGAWVAPIDNSYIQRYFSLLGVGSVAYKFFKVNPSVMNPIFTQDATSENNTDQLLVNASFDISAVRNLDRNGLPY